jgi:hypothetical protein
MIEPSSFKNMRPTPLSGRKTSRIFRWSMAATSGVEQ